MDVKTAQRNLDKLYSHPKGNYTVNKDKLVYIPTWNFFGRCVKWMKDRDGAISQKVQAIISDSRKTAILPRGPNELKNFPGVKEHELKKLRRFYIETKSTLNNETKFFNRNFHYPHSKFVPPRSLVFIPGKGTFVLIKQHRGQKQLGLGASNRVTLAVNIETGQQVAWRSAAKGGVKQSEIDANKAASRYPNHFLAADNFVDYAGNIRPDYQTRLNKISYHTRINKIGSIVPLSKGGDLESYLTKNKPSVKTRLMIFSEFQGHLDVMHTNLKLTHRDLKPANLMMTEDGHVRITDFGLTVDNNSRHVRGGSPLWVPPEVYRGEENITPSIDIWSSGVILLEMLGGQDPWRQNFLGMYNGLQHGIVNPQQIDHAKKAAYGAVVNNLKKERCNDEQIRAILGTIDACLNLDPAKRPSARQLQVAVGNIASGLSTGPRPIV